MSRPQPQHFRRRKISAEASRRSLLRQLGIVFSVGLLAAAITAVLLIREQSVPAEQLVKVYRTHGCTCAFAWADALKAEGFVVRFVEYETLKHVRDSLHTPGSLRGCHVGAYLDYFLEGHVSPSALRELATQRPRGLGLATEGSVTERSVHVSIARDEKSRVLLVERDGRTRAWFQPPGNPNG